MKSAYSEQTEQIQTLGDIPRIYAAARPDAIATKFEGRTTTYSSLEAHTNKIANALLDTDVKSGERIGYLGKNSDFYFELMFGAAKMGAITLPIGWRLAAVEIAHILKDGEVSLLFLSVEFADLAKEAIKHSGRSVRVIELENPAEEGFKAWRDDHSADDPGVKVSPSDVVMQLYTSGTTGRPKGVMLSHDNLLRMWIKSETADTRAYIWSEHEVSLVAMPVSHVGGSSWGIVGFIHGASMLIIKEFDPSAIIQLIPNEGITKMFLVPAAMNFLLQMPGAKEVDYSKLKVIFYGASPIPLDLLRQCMEVFGCDFCQQYGMTEAAGTIVYLPPEDHDPEGNRRMRSAGRAMPAVELKIIDSDGNTLPAETVGEVAIRSSCVMVGYWNNEEATKSTINNEGWLRSGDAGYLDEDGYLYIHDRVKDMIISGAENIYPAEVESAMFGHPDIADVAIIGVPDDKWGEAVKAVVVLKPGAEADEQSILAYTQSNIAKFKVPKSIDFVEALPRNPTGKVLKRSLREPYWAGKDRNVN